LKNHLSTCANRPVTQWLERSPRSR